LQVFKIHGKSQGDSELDELPNQEEKAEDPYRSIMRMANDGIVVIQDNEVVLANRAFSRILDYEEDKIAGIPFDDLLDPVSAHLFKENQEEFNWGEEARPSFRARLQKRDDTIIDVEMSTADFIFEGKPAIVAVVRDITEKLALQAALEDSESRYRGLYDSSPIAYFTLSLHGIILQANKAAERLLGYGAGDLLKRNISTFFISHESRENVGNQILSEVAQGKRITDLEIQMKKSNEKPIWVSVTASLVMSPDQTPTIGFMAMDIDRRKLAEQREREERARADLYLEVMTHDLNNVNQNMLFTLGFIEGVFDLPENLQRTIRDANWNVRRAARMISNMKAIITLRDSPPVKEPMDPYIQYENGLAAVREDLHWKSIKINSELKPDEYSVVGYNFLEKVFFNIIHNAAVYDNDDDIIIDLKVEYMDKKRRIRLSFEDNGPGMSEKLKKHIFRRTGDPSEQVVGRGLGLTLTDLIVRDLGGRIWAEDKVDDDPSQGTRIKLELPLWIEEAELPCGRESCIRFYKSNQCLFCEPVYEILILVADELGIPEETIKVINVDDPNAGVSEEDLPMLPCVRICESDLVGLVTDEQVRNNLFALLVKPCYPE
jgi:PAS domain S-box-containing protein